MYDFIDENTKYLLLMRNVPGFKWFISGIYTQITLSILAFSKKSSCFLPSQEKFH